jgi:hypothetical protein
MLKKPSPDNNERYNFGGRLRPLEEQPNMLQLVELQHKRMAFVYKRLSTHEQIKKSVFSIAMQDALEDMAVSDGYQPRLKKEEVEAIKKDPGYPKFYVNGQIVVEERDLGFSGTLGSDEREGLAHLIEKIEADVIESLYIVHISRLFRDQSLINGYKFGELCKEHNVVIVMPNMRLNLIDRMHMRIYRMELDRAAEELEIMKLRLGGAKQLKARQGFYASGAIPIGYALDTDKDSKTYDKYVIYKPHAHVIRKIFDALFDCNFSPAVTARKLQDSGVYVPYWPPEFQYMEKRSGTKRMQRRGDKGFIITPSFVDGVITNPVYIGWWIWGGTVLSKENHSPIVDEETFWLIQQRLKEKGRSKGRSVRADPMMLHKLLHCTHTERHLRGTNCMMMQDRRRRRYGCLGGEDHTRGERKWCFSIAAYVLEEPIKEYVVDRCSFSDYADKVVAILREGYAEAKNKAAGNKREFARVKQEIKRLKENLAYTKTKQQTELILEMIEERTRELESMAKAGVEAYPAGRVGKQLNIVRVKGILDNIGIVWERKSDKFKNELLRILVDRIMIREKDGQRGSNIIARIVWVTGTEEEIEITRPHIANLRDHAWTSEEKEILRRYYGHVSWGELCTMLPKRSYTTILAKAHRMGFTGNSRKSRKGVPRRPWTEEEDELLRQIAENQAKLNARKDKEGGTNGGGMIIDEIAAKLRRNPELVKDRLRLLGLPTFTRYEKPGLRMRALTNAQESQATKTKGPNRKVTESLETFKVHWRIITPANPARPDMSGHIEKGAAYMAETHSMDPTYYSNERQYSARS